MTNVYFVTSDNSEFGGTCIYLYGPAPEVKTAIGEITENRGWEFEKTTKREMVNYLDDCPNARAIDVLDESQGYVAWRELLAGA